MTPAPIVDVEGARQIVVVAEVQPIVTVAQPILAKECLVDCAV